jgi:hypothetical protein
MVEASGVPLPSARFAACHLPLLGRIDDDSPTVFPVRSGAISPAVFEIVNRHLASGRRRDRTP